MRPLILVLLSCFLPLSAYAAQDSILFANVGKWAIYSDPTTANSCFAMSTYADGTSIRIGFWHKGYKYPAYVAFANEKWRSIQVGKEYDVSMRLDTAPAWTGPASGWQIGTFKAILINVDKPNLFKEFISKNQLQLVFRGKLVANLSLAGSGKAVAELMNCQSINVDGMKPSPRESDDPFSIQEVKPKTDDPFEL